MPRVEETRDKVDKVYGYFNNHYHGYAMENCIEILEMLNAARPEHKKVKERIIRHNITKKPLMYERKLEEFGYDISRLSVEDLLLKLTDRQRFKRGKEIDNTEMVIKESSSSMVKAKIRDYIVEINLKDKSMKHNCDDWRKGLGIKRVCKHLVKLFLTIEPEESKRILKDILEGKDNWKFLT